MTRPYEDKIRTVAEWHCQHMRYWDLYLGDLYNRIDHWDECFHHKSIQDWWDFYDVAEVLCRQYPDQFHRYPGLATNIKTIEERLKFSKPVVKATVKDYNHAPFSAWMKFKDFLNDIAGTPTRQYTDQERKQAQKLLEPQTQFETLFEIEDRK